MESSSGGGYVLSKLSSLLYGGGGQDAEANMRQYWMPDDISLECYECTSKFTSFRRRHHCRVCGQVFCSKCCSSYIPGKHIVPGHTGTIRVCTSCLSSYQASDQGGVAPAPVTGQETHDDTIGTSSPVQYRRRPSIDQVASSSSPGAYSNYRKVSSTVPLYTREQSESGSDSVAGDSSQTEEIIKLRDPHNLNRLWARMMDPELGVKLETHRYYLRSYPGTVQGRSLVEWLVGQDSGHTSHGQAVAIGQALVTAGMMSSVSGSEQFQGGTDLYIPVLGADISDEVKDEPDHDGVNTNTAAVHEPAWLQELPKYSVMDKPAGVGVDKTTVGNGKAEEEPDVALKANTSNSMIDVGIGDLHESVVMDPDDSEDLQALENVYKKHERDYLDTLMRIENIPEDWSETIGKLADTAVTKVTPMVRGSGDEMDILTYVKVKCVPGGQRSDSRLVEGEVCSLQLTHKTMAHSIVKPRIALVAESIMFKNTNTMVSLETVSMQEAEYVKNVIGKLLDLKPSLILVEKSVTHLAQDILKNEGVSLAVNVKPKVLSRLSRLTQASIIKSVDTMISPPRLGTCGHVTSQYGGPGSGRLLVFEGCDPALGGTIMLTGGDRRFLSKVKAILKRLILLKYNWKHEKSLLANEYGSMMDPSAMNNLDSTNYQLAISPFIKVVKVDNEVPFAVEVTDDSSVMASDDIQEKDEDTKERHPWCDQFLTRNITSLTDKSFTDQQALFRAAGWRRHHSTQHRIKTKQKFSVVLPEDHTEVLSVQFSMFSKQSRVAPNYCVSPFVVAMQLYALRDMALGEFLEELCFASDYVCPNKQCSTPPILHTRRFCHAGGAVTLHMQQLEAPLMGEDTDKLMMWKYCTSCEMITNIVPVSDLTWSLSFAIFLHLLLHENKLVRRGASRPDAVCTHSLHQEHLTCFGKGDQVVTFRFSKLHVWDIETPQDKMIIPDQSYSRELLTKKLLAAKEASCAMFDAVLKKLHNFGDSGLETDHDQEHRSFRERLEKMEESVDNTEDDFDDKQIMSLLRLFQRDVMRSHSSWSKRLTLLQEASKSTKRLDSVRSVSESVDPKRSSENDTTVKKIISTILPHSEDISIPSPFTPDIHLISHVRGVELDFPSTHFVHESKPSTVISYLLSSASYKQYLSSPDDQHFVLEMSDATTKFYCCSYFTSEFHQLRKLLLKEEEDGQGELKFVQSLMDCSRWEAMGGKSGLMFYKTSDDRFVLKQMSKFEYGSFLEFAPHYFNYMSDSLEHNIQTLLGKIVGVYKVGFKNSVTGAGMNMELLIMENLFFNRNVSKSYDLKGSIRNRLILEADTQQGMVLLDENLLRVSCESPLYVNQQDKDVLNEAIKRDSAFLASHCMMDYSLLAGICDEDNSLVVGIIDYIRTFTWDKKLETLVKSVKSSGVFGGQAKTPTVINPDLYKARFSEAMNRYFSVVPQ